MKKVAAIALIILLGTVSAYANPWMEILYPADTVHALSAQATRGDAAFRRARPQYARMNLMAALDSRNIYSRVIYGYRLSALIQNAQELKAVVARETYGDIVKITDPAKTDAWGKVALTTDAAKEKTTYGGIAKVTDPSPIAAWGKPPAIAGDQKIKTSYGGIVQTQDPRRTDAWGKSSDPALISSWVNYQRGKRNYFHY